MRPYHWQMWSRNIRPLENNSNYTKVVGITLSSFLLSLGKNPPIMVSSTVVVLPSPDTHPSLISPSLVCVTLLLTFCLAISVLPSVSFSISVCLCHHLCLSLSPSLSVSVTICLSLSMSPSLYVSVSICLSLPISISPCVSPSVCLSPSVSVCPSDNTHTHCLQFLLVLPHPNCHSDLALVDMREPVFEYKHPVFYHPPQKMYPHKEPFDRWVSHADSWTLHFPYSYEVERQCSQHQDKNGLWWEKLYWS